MIIRVLRLSAEDGSQLAASGHPPETAPGAEWHVAAERGTEEDRPERIILTAWREPHPAAFARVSEGVLELFESPDEPFGDPRSVVAGDAFVMTRGYALEGAEARVVAAGRAVLAAGVHSGRIGAAGIGRRVVGGRLELLLVRIGRENGGPPVQVTDLLAEWVEMGYVVTAAHTGTPAQTGGPAFQ